MNLRTLIVASVLFAASMSVAQQPSGPPQTVADSPTATGTLVSSRLTVDDCQDPTTFAKSEHLCNFLLQVKRFNQPDWSAVPAWGLVVTALLGLLTIVFNFRNAAAQTELQMKMKALEVVISANGPVSAIQRLDILNRVLGFQLPDPEPQKDLTAGSAGPPTDRSLKFAGLGPGHDVARRELLTLLAEHHEHRAQILSDWETIFSAQQSPNLYKSIVALKR